MVMMEAFLDRHEALLEKAKDGSAMDRVLQNWGAPFGLGPKKPKRPRRAITSRSRQTVRPQKGWQRPAF